MMSIANLIWICPVCTFIGMMIAVFIINDGGYPDD